MIWPLLLPSLPTVPSLPLSTSRTCQTSSCQGHCCSLHSPWRQAHDSSPLSGPRSCLRSSATLTALCKPSSSPCHPSAAYPLYLSFFSRGVTFVLHVNLMIFCFFPLEYKLWEQRLLAFVHCCMPSRSRIVCLKLLTENLSCDKLFCICADVFVCLTYQ